MAVMTLSRTLGSLGFETAKVVAERTGYRLVWRELINQAALRAGAPEVALAMIDELNLLGLRPSSADIQAYLKAVSAVMRELADAGNVVIVGRAGQIILGNRPDTLHVRMIAPVALRVERLAQRHSISHEAAQAQVETSDRYHQNYFKRYYRTTWDAPGLYDLVINTARLTREDAADIICLALDKCTTCPPEPDIAAGEAC